MMAEAEKALIELSADEDDKAKKSKAEIYVKIMRKVASDGQTFATSEIERVKKILDGKLSASKKEQMEQRINVLKSFVTTEPEKKKEEL